jgi:MraZ protein
VLYQGETPLVFDDKGRVTIPKEIRDDLAQSCAGMLTVVRNPDGCLMLYPRPDWEVKKLEIANWPLNRRRWQRLLLGSALSVEIDNVGRISIPSHAREAINMGKKVLLRGSGRFYELWDLEAYRAYENQTTAQGEPDDIGSFTW